MRYLFFQYSENFSNYFENLHNRNADIRASEVRIYATTIAILLAINVKKDDISHNYGYTI